MSIPNNCPTCGLILSADTPASQCGHCLLQLGLMVDSEPDPPERIGLAEKPGDWIGCYKLIQVLGEGGCGKVYLAEQEKPVRRRIALKIIKLGMDTAQFIARFEAERQALALMDHPNIARVFDAGATKTGRPFFVMELVHGERITDYCNRRQLSIKDRLGLFNQVCQAIQHAHQKGIIHRDLKPSNVLVAEIDGVAVPKVIDFGIAKATGGQQLTDKTLFTAFEQFIGTPAYMSPEQAELGGSDIDTRSDIYSLGVLLYELLTGKMPFEPQRLFDAGLDEIRRIIREEEPPRPSTRISTLNADEKTSVAAQHQTEPPRLIHQIRGDLDWIVMKALEKDRARRYATANDFALDLLRHLNNEPVVARPPSNVYRLQKMVRRNRLVFASAAIVFCALVTALLISTWRFRKEQEARERLTISEREQTRLREIAELRAYSSDMNLAAQAAQASQSRGSLSGVENLLASWRNHTPDLRGWEWYYLNGLSHHDSLTVAADTNGLLALCWSTDGDRFAVAGKSGQISIWNARDGRKLISMKRDPGAHIQCLAWHPQKNELASSSNLGWIALWNAAQNAAIRSWRAHTGHIRSIAWSSDGRRLASAGWEGTAGIWNAETGEEVFRLQSTSAVQGVAWSPDDKVLAVGTGKFLAELWDTSTGKHLRNIADGNNAALAWSPDGRFLATGGVDSQIRIWEIATGKRVVAFLGHSGSVAVLQWSPDGKHLTSTGRDDGAIKIWEPFTGKLAQHFRGHIFGAQAIAWHPGATKIASASLDGTAKIWDTQSDDPSRIQLENTNAVSSAAWSRDGGRLVVSDKNGQVQIWNGRDKFPAKMFAGRNWSWDVALHPNGQQVASIGMEGFVELWDATSGTSIRTVSAFNGAGRAIVWNPQGTMLAAGGTGYELKVWDAFAQNLIASVNVLYSPTYALDWSPDGTLVAAAAGFTIRIVDVAARRLSQSCVGHRDTARCVAWSPDGTMLVSGGDDLSAIIWDAKTGAMRRKLSGHGASIYSVAWSPDGQRIVTGNWDCTLKIWNSNTGQELCSIETHRNPVMAVAWHPDGRRIVSGDLGGELFIHDSSPGYQKE